MFHKSIQSVFLISVMFLLGASLSACDSNSKPPELMKAVKQFESDEIRDGHIKNMRINHMDELLHKRDETVIKGIRTKDHSLKSCINCHVPDQHNGKVLRSSDPEHFCSTCHNFVAQKLDCFQCHVDHPNNSKVSKVAPSDATHSSVKFDAPSQKHLASTVAEAEIEIHNSPKQTIGEK